MRNPILQLDNDIVWTARIKLIVSVYIICHTDSYEFMTCTLMD